MISNDLAWHTLNAGFQFWQLPDFGTFGSSPGSNPEQRRSLPDVTRRIEPNRPMLLHFSFAVKEKLKSVVGQFEKFDFTEPCLSGLAYNWIDSFC